MVRPATSAAALGGKAEMLGNSRGLTPLSREGSARASVGVTPNWLRAVVKASLVGTKTVAARVGSLSTEVQELLLLLLLLLVFKASKALKSAIPAGAAMTSGPARAATSGAIAAIGAASGAVAAMMSGPARAATSGAIAAIGAASGAVAAMMSGPARAATSGAIAAIGAASGAVAAIGAASGATSWVPTIIGSGPDRACATNTIPCIPRNAKLLRHASAAALTSSNWLEVLPGGARGPGAIGALSGAIPIMSGAIAMI
ncbi:MAG: hypothetical protein FRX49_11319 [Trebouxia sp. A1-2]|nr:MAG: hypothetical protein FRX49_11319 [Trebouxia sp. A1-2]